MRAEARVVLLLAVAGSGVALLASTWPGGLELFALAVVFSCFLWVPAGALAAFFVSRPAFERRLADAPESDFGEPLDEWLGLHRVNEWARDPRGGVYFQTLWHLEGIGPDAMSYGFAWRPNPEGSPFGAARYRRLQVLGNWYLFAASDDW